MDLDTVNHPGRFFTLMARDLKSLAISNIQFFENGKQSHHAKFHMSFSLLYEYLDIGIEPSYKELSKYVHLYDFSPDVKGNGYRSLLQIVHKCCLHLLQLSRYISSVKDSMLFRKRYYAKELEAYVSALGQLRAILYYALKLVHYCQEGELFADDETLDNAVADHLMMEVESLNQECFYGRCLGFQFCESMMRPVQIMNIAMASYSEGYLESSGVMQVATSVFNSGKYFMDPELRATQLAKVTRTADIQFCKAFWSISESGPVQQLPSMVCPFVEVNESFPLGPDAFELPLVDGSDTVVITPPCAHIGPGHVMVRLLSAQLREGQQTFQKYPKSKSPVVTKPRTPGLIIHIHGGGFIAQSSKSHEIYLRDWARIVDIPILSVDYSLAPELPFPRALEDCFYAYAWAVKNCLQLGSLGERIVMCGDSAGGNLAISTAMRAASFDIRRPDGVLGVYPVTMVRYLPSPARLLSLMDPILPVGIVSRCLAAYAGINEEHPLASPSTQEFQSKSSLNTIQMQTAESSDNDWVIIGQDKDECHQIGQRMDHSPIGHNPAAAASPVSPSSLSSFSSAASKSVIDSMEDSFHEEEESAGDSLMVEGTRRKLHRSDTLESDEVEIFSQLQLAGSCTFSKEDNNKAGGGGGVETGPRENRNRNIREMGSGGGGGNQKISDNLISIQEKAKSVMEGAQSMLTSLSSYIPSRVSGSSVTSNPASSSPSKSGGVVKSSDFYVNRSVSSDAVDPSSIEKGDDDGASVPNASKSDDFSCDASSSVFEKGEVMDVASPTTPDRLNRGSDNQTMQDGKECHQQNDESERSACEYVTAELGFETADDDNDENATKVTSLSDLSEDTNINSSFSQEVTSRHQSAPSASASNHPPPLTPPPTPDKTQTHQGVSRHHHDTDSGGDHPTNQDHNFDSISPTSDATDGANVLTMTKPTVGVSPIDEFTNNKHLFSESETTKNSSSPLLSPSTQEQLPSTTTEPSQSLSLPDSPSKIPPNSPSSHLPHSHQQQQQQSLQDSSIISSPSNSHSAVVFPTQSSVPLSLTAPHPNNQPLSSTLNQRTTPENLISVATTSTTTSTTTPEHEQFLTPADHIPEQIGFEDAATSHDKDQNFNNDRTSTPSSKDSNSKLARDKDIITEPNLSTPTSTTSTTITNCTNTTHGIIHSPPSPPPHTTTTSTTTPPKPPSNLNLFSTTTKTTTTTAAPNPIPQTLSPSQKKQSVIASSPSPSPNQIFTEQGSGSDLDSTDTDVDASTFNASCLQFLAPSSSPMPNDEAYYTSHHAMSDAVTGARFNDGIFRSDSVPAFSTLLSPMSPVDPEVKGKMDATKRPLPFPNGLKMGMSPSDFKRQTFTTHSPVNTMRKALVVRNPYMSPLMAGPELLKGLPPVCIVASHLDPLLDDSVMFAKRLKRLDMPVELHLLDDLPHGFLNFSLLSQEAKKASQFCAKKLLEMVNKES